MKISMPVWVLVGSLLIAGCYPVKSRTWTVVSGDNQVHTAEHIEVDDVFTIREVRGVAVIEPRGELATRWGFEKRALSPGNSGKYCLEVDLGHSHDPSGDGHRFHWFVFETPADGNPRRMSVKHSRRGSLSQSCSSYLTHEGTLHAED